MQAPLPPPAAPFMDSTQAEAVQHVFDSLLAEHRVIPSSPFPPPPPAPPSPSLAGSDDTTLAMFDSLLAQRHLIPSSLFPPPSLPNLQVQTTLDMGDSLLAQHRDVAQRSKTLYSSCEQIVKEKEQLEEFADALRAKLRWVGGWVGGWGTST